MKLIGRCDGNSNPNIQSEQTALRMIMTGKVPERGGARSTIQLRPTRLLIKGNNKKLQIASRASSFFLWLPLGFRWQAYIETSRNSFLFFIILAKTKLIHLFVLVIKKGLFAFFFNFLFCLWPIQMSSCFDFVCASTQFHPAYINFIWFNGGRLKMLHGFSIMF